MEKKIDNNNENIEINSEEKIKENKTIKLNTQEIEEYNNTQNKEESITKFALGDKFHPINSEDEIIEYIGERIRALENLENCKKLKVKS